MEEHSPRFNLVKDFFDDGYWDDHRVTKAVEKGWITEEESKEILGKETISND